jgi:hypothetical protein
LSDLEKLAVQKEQDKQQAKKSKQEQYEINEKVYDLQDLIDEKRVLHRKCSQIDS